MRYAIALTLCLSLMAAPALAQDNNYDQFKDAPKRPGARPGENIALGAPYTLQPGPDYQHCTDPGDATQLTDGVYSEGYFWVQKSTVGWRGENPVIITVDLGADRPICGASYHTAAGVAGVTWPAVIYVFVAGEDKVFHQAGDLVALSLSRGLPAPDGYSTYRYWTDALHTHGRYVTFVTSAQPYAFVDEIEIYEGKAEWLGEPVPGAAVKDIGEFVKSLGVQSAVVRRLQFDAQEIRQQAEAPGIPDAVRSEVLAELEAVTAEFGTIGTGFEADFRAILPLNPLHARLLRAEAALWRAQGIAPLTVWQSDLWERLPFLATPPRKGKARLRVDMMSNEYRAASFNLSNAAHEPATLGVRVVGLPGGPNPPYVTVHEVLWTDSKSSRPVPAALPVAPQQGDGYRIEVPAGITRQVWLTFHPEDVPAGTHKGHIEVTGGPHRARIPVTLKIYPSRFPDRPSLHFGGWDYTNGSGHRGVTPENMDALIAHLREHYVDSPWATNGVMPLGQYDSAGAMTTEPSTAAFDEWAARWPDCGQYLVFSNVPDTMAGLAPGTPAFDAAVKAWCEFWAGHVRSLGIEPAQLGLLVRDEPHQPEHDAAILPWAKAIRAAGTGLRVWEDPCHTDMAKADPEMIAACHVLCPNRPRFFSADQAYRDYYIARRDQGTTLEFYSCSGPVRYLDPYSYHRIQAWHCWQYEAKGSYFWAFGDNGGGSSWNEYAAPGTDYCPMFLDDTSVTAGKHMEACREGIEDYEYLAMLEAAIENAESRGVCRRRINRARAVLTQAPARVTAAAPVPGHPWYKELDRTVADAARVEILEALTALEKAKRRR
ncbi:MAG: hypothetical protein JXR94_19800 [Candidatus Hydrogenedentes bacterium]|nr:hypothetical protein [Candidatus Hydrogenedentota bacterium]